MKNQQQQREETLNHGHRCTLPTFVYVSKGPKADIQAPCFMSVNMARR